jgi:hypothetical protein
VRLAAGESGPGGKAPAAGEGIFGDENAGVREFSRVSRGMSAEVYFAASAICRFILPSRRDINFLRALQSCVDEQRSCKVRFEGECSTQQAYFSVPQPSAITVPGGDVVQITYPILATNHASKKIWVHVEVDVDGGAGLRNRSVRRGRAPKRVSGLQTALFLLGSLFYTPRRSGAR